MLTFKPSAIERKASKGKIEPTIADAFKFDLEGNGKTLPEHPTLRLIPALLNKSALPSLWRKTGAFHSAQGEVD